MNDAGDGRERKKRMMNPRKPMRRLFAGAGLLLLSIVAATPPAAAAPTEGWKLRYQRSYNGKPVEGQDPIWVFAAKGEALISSEAILAGKAGFPFEQSLIKPAAQELLQLARLSREEAIASLDRESLPKQSYEFSEETRTILGYRCKKAKTVVNSNTIELWYTTELPAAGAPTVLGHQLGLVLELVRNGNFVISATQIEPFQGLDLAEMANGGSTGGSTGGKAATPALLDGLSYKDRVWRSRFTTIPVFQDQIVNFSGEDREPREGVTRYANGTVVLKTVQLPEIAPGSQVFVDLLARSNGDAYDRTGSVFVIPLGAKDPSHGKKATRNFMDGLQRGVAALPAYQNGNGRTYRGVVATEDYAPLIELMRFFTPFGVKHYNPLQLKGKTWHEAAPYRMDITDLAQRLSGQALALGVFIGNYDKGGHKLKPQPHHHPPQRRRHCHVLQAGEPEYRCGVYFFFTAAADPAVQHHQCDGDGRAGLRHHVRQAQGPGSGFHARPPAQERPPALHQHRPRRLDQRRRVRAQEKHPPAQRQGGVCLRALAPGLRRFPPLQPGLRQLQRRPVLFRHQPLQLVPRHRDQPDLHRPGSPQSRTAPDDGADSAGAA